METAPSSAPAPTFQSEGWSHINGLGPIAFVRLDRDADDFAHLKNKEVLIDGVAHTCVGVEAFMHGGGWRKGERVALLVKGDIT